MPGGYSASLVTEWPLFEGKTIIVTAGDGIDTLVLSHFAAIVFERRTTLVDEFQVVGILIALLILKVFGHGDVFSPRWIFFILAASPDVLLAVLGAVFDPGEEPVEVVGLVRSVVVQMLTGILARSLVSVEPRRSRVHRPP